MDCNCKDYKKNMELLNEPFVFLTARNPQSYKGYQGKQFIYCPFCGKKLRSDNDKRKSDKR